MILIRYGYQHTVETQPVPWPGKYGASKRELLADTGSDTDVNEDLHTFYSSPHINRLVERKLT